MTVVIGTDVSIDKVGKATVIGAPLGAAETIPPINKKEKAVRPSVRLFQLVWSILVFMQMRFLGWLLRLPAIVRETVKRQFSTECTG